MPPLAPPSDPARPTHGVLSPGERELAHRLRQAARIVGHAALPAEYRDAAFARVLELELVNAGVVQPSA